MNRLTLPFKFYLILFVFVLLFIHVYYSKVLAADLKTKARQGIVKIIATKSGDVDDTGARIILYAKRDKKS